MFRFLIITALLGLAACGFEPVYGTGQTATQLRKNIDVEVQNGRYSFEFREHLQDRFGRAGDGPEFLLNYTLTISPRAFGITATQEITRYNLTGTVSYRITDQRSGAVVFTDLVTANTAYSATAETFPTRVAEEDASIRVVKALAEQIVTRLAITADDWLK